MNYRFSGKTRTKGMSYQWGLILVGVLCIAYTLLDTQGGIANQVPRRISTASSTSIISSGSGSGSGSGYPAELPCRNYRQAIIHDSRSKMRNHYENHVSTASYNLNGPPGTNNDIPELKRLDSDKIGYMVSKFAPGPEVSAWTATKDIEGGFFVQSQRKQSPLWESLTGDFVSFIGFAGFAYGHFNNQNLPTIAWLREQVPETTRFILLDHPIARTSIWSLDPDFYDRIYWLPAFQRVEINGSLVVPILPSLPMEFADMRPMTSLRKWVYDKKAAQEKKYVLFYSRQGAGHDRVLAHEPEVLLTIRVHMASHKKNMKLIVFNGKDADGSTMPMDKQQELFRSADTIIGSHGAGMLGNLIWTDPYPKTCDDRTKILEFINGKDSKHVQGNVPYISAFLNFRKWPLDYHVLTYAAKSDGINTYIDITSLHMALQSMWGEPSSAIKKE